MATASPIRSLPAESERLRRQLRKWLRTCARAGGITVDGPEELPRWTASSGLGAQRAPAITLAVVSGSLPSGASISSKEGGLTDSKRGQLFTKIAERSRSPRARAGGIRPATAALATAIEKAARRLDAPGQNRAAIPKGTGAGTDAELRVDQSHEGYGPAGGVAILAGPDRQTQQHQRGHASGISGSAAKKNLASPGRCVDLEKKGRGSGRKKRPRYYEDDLSPDRRGSGRHQPRRRRTR